MLADYQLWVIERDTYARVTQIETFIKLRYVQRLNNCGSFALTVDADYSKVPDLAQQAALVIYRNGVEMLSGIINRARYLADAKAPSGEVWAADGLDRGSYLKWRIIPCIGVEHDSRTGPADDVMKAYVRAHAGSLAGVRACTDLVVAADTSAAPSYPAEARNVYLLSYLQKIAEATGVWFRVVPDSITGVQTFTTAYPLWGLDCTRGNGVNPELILSFDRRNVQEIEYGDDRLDLCNAVYVGGQGEGAARRIRLREDAASIATNLRREHFYEDRLSTVDTTLDAHGDGYLVEHGPQVWLTGTPNEDLWPSWYDLGYAFTIAVQRGSLSVLKDVVCTGIAIEVADGRETISPEMIER